MERRRIFLAQAAALSAGLLIKPGNLLAAQPKVAGLQLYTLRDQLPGNVSLVLKKVANAGYKQVETFCYSVRLGYWEVPDKDFAKLLTDNGLITPSGHYDFNQFFGNGDRFDVNSYIKIAHITGQQYIIIPALHQKFFQTADDFKRVAGKMNEAGEIFRKEGLNLGYHNHDFEWKPTGNTTFYDTLLDYTDPALVHFEMDIFFIIKAGKDPLAYFDKYKNRFKLVHIKDRDKTDPEKNTEVGNGSIDFKPIIDKAKASGIKYFIGEQENFTNIDPFVSIKQSADYIKNVLKV